MRRLETINVAMTPNQPLGMTPSALGLSPDGKRLFVACSDANAVAAVDISQTRSVVQGFIPTGWYPTAVSVLPDNRIVILNGRGLGSHPNLDGPNPTKRPEPVHEGGKSQEYVLRIQTGTISFVDSPSDKDLFADTEAVIANSPYRDSLMDSVAIPQGNPVPSRPAILRRSSTSSTSCKENRTYDQVLGDMKKGNGDASLVLFGENVTPNQHKLAQRVRAVRQLLRQRRRQRRRPQLVHCGHRAGLRHQALAQQLRRPPQGVRLRRAGSRHRAPGRISLDQRRTRPASACAISATSPPIARLPDPTASRSTACAIPFSGQVTNPYYRAFDLDYSGHRTRQSLHQGSGRVRESGNQMPQLITDAHGQRSHLRSGGRKGRAAIPRPPITTRGIGMVVEAVSKSKFWSETAIFIIEDDAQNGCDHVDSHRSPAYLISPYVTPRLVDSSMYNTTSVLRTMELILGLRPMTTFRCGRPAHVRCLAEHARP